MAGGSTDTGVFALSGTPSPASAVWPEFLCATRTNGILTFKWCAAEGEAYQVQYKTNLTQTSWLNLGIPVTATNGIMPGSDALTNSQRFYRILLEQ